MMLTIYGEMRLYDGRVMLSLTTWAPLSQKIIAVTCIECYLNI